MQLNTLMVLREKYFIFNQVDLEMLLNLLQLNFIQNQLKRFILFVTD
ncbi:hypothetical protein B0I10_109122 [Flavobacterium lacus]|uniref:Uncharacterized protein n=1 Tax=Flavobacterium lacus TaxID=1353778 RepID=A0A328WVX6_9FLAO|nr:hypothetical protein B0I10_109122 [Flavobacterium lacus]